MDRSASSAFLAPIDLISASSLFSLAKVASFTDIMRRMPFVQSQFKRTLTLFLPCCLAWSFVACLWLCSHHDGEGYESCAYDQKQTLDIHGDSDHCPINVMPSVLPDKQSTNVTEVHSVVHSFIATFSDAYGPQSAARVRSPQSCADPPLERLFVYRI